MQSPGSGGSARRLHRRLAAYAPESETQYRVQAKGLCLPRAAYRLFPSIESCCAWFENWVDQSTAMRYKSRWMEIGRSGSIPSCEERSV